MSRALKVFISIFIIYVLGFVTKFIINGEAIYGDGRYYYAYARSIIFDHDISFSNEYSILNINEPITLTGASANKYSIGSALLWLPALTSASFAFKGTGFELPYQLITGLQACFYAAIGVYILYLYLKTIYSEQNSIIAVVLISFTTPLWFYGSLDTINSHAATFFFASILLFVTEHSDKTLVQGCILGALGLCRTQELIQAFLCFKHYSIHKYLYFLFGFFTSFIIQLIIWKFLYNSWYHSPYISQSEGFNLLKPHLFETLFSTNNGILLWTPSLLLALVGLIFYTIRSQKYHYLIIVLLQWWIISSWSSWSQGASFSGRMFIGILPIMGIGYAEIVSYSRSKRISYSSVYFVSILLIVSTAATMVYYLLTHA